MYDLNNTDTAPNTLTNTHLEMEIITAALDYQTVFTRRK